jgi:TonB family protein
MKIHLTTLLFSTAALTLPAVAQASVPAPASLNKTIRLERYVEPEYPAKYRNTTTNEGYAQAQLLVAADGRIVECFVSAYSHPEFAASVEHAVQSWVFRAADPGDAGALPQRFNVRISFRSEGMTIVQGDFQQTVKAFLGQKDADSEVDVCKLRDLDTTPEPVNLVVPAYPEELKKQKIEGGAAISFFIDEQGRVRVPSVAGSTRPEFAAAALEAVGKWTFVPPLRKGQPTRVFAVQEFSFTPATEAVSGKTAK